MSHYPLPDHPLRVLGLAGSLRRGSYNRALLEAAVDAAPSSMQIDVYDLDDLPMFNADLESGGDPAEVTAFKQAVSEADALLIVSPEYNGSVTPVIKNAVDWASRRYEGRRLLRELPVALAGASRGKWGTLKAQMHLRDSLIHVGAYVLTTPSLYVGDAPSKFDDDLRLTDEDTRRRLARLLDALADWTRRLHPAAEPVAAAEAP